MNNRATRKTILIVDDEPNILASIESLFEDDFHVLTCGSGEEAIGLLAANSISAILSDQRMPGMSGDEFLAKAREVSEATRILITGYADLDAVVRAVNQGQIYGYVAKPWDPFQLKVLVDRAVEHYMLIEELQHEKNLLHTLMDNSVDAIFIKDAERRFLRANRSMAKLFELNDPRELVGKRTEDFDTVSAYLVDDVKSREEELLVTSIPQPDEIVLGEYPDGRRIWFSISRAPIIAAGDKVDGLVGIVRDVSARLKAEEDLRTSEAKFRDFATTASDWFWETDDNHLFTLFSERFTEVTGFDPSDYLGKRSDQVEFEGVDPRVVKDHIADLEARRGFRDFTYVRRRADGRQMWLSINGTPVFDDDGTFLGYRGTGTNVTDRKRAEEAVALVSGIALKLSEVSNIDEAFQLTLGSVCLRLGWTLGEAWVADRDDDRMKIKTSWCKDAELLEKFTDRARNLALAPGEGLQGRVWQSREPIWVVDTASETPETFFRRDLALKNKIKGACAIPVVASDKVVAVLEFFIREPHEEHRSWMTALAAATAPLGAFLQRIAAEHARRESEMRFREFADIGTDWLWETDAQHRFSWISQRLTTVTGVPVESLLGKTREESGIEGVDEDTCREHLEDLQARRPFRDFVYARRRPDEQLGWLSITGNPRFDDGGKFLGYRGVGTDITHRINAEQAIREREQTVRLLLNSTAEAIYGVDTERRCTFCNPATLDLLGYTEEDELLGRNMHDLTHHTTRTGEPYPREKCPISSAIKVGRPAHSDEDVFWGADGSPIPVEYWSHPVFNDGKLTGAVITFLDITDRRRAQEAIQLVNQIAAAATEVSDAEQAFAMALKAMCERLDWALGEAWVPKDGVLHLVACWHEADAGLDRFESESRGYSFERGGGLPGRVWGSKKPSWIVDTAGQSTGLFPRNTLAAECGLKASCAIPVVINDEVIAVLAFFLRRSQDEDARWLDALAAAATPLGSVLQRIVAEAQMASMARFHGESPSPVLRISREGIIHSANAAASELLDIWGVAAGKLSPSDIKALVNDMLESNLPQQIEVEGEQKTFSLHMVPIADEDYVNVYGNDVTEQKKTERMLRQVQKMEAIGQLTGGVAHDFNNRLTVMLGNLELLEERLADNAAVLKLVKGARRAAEGGAKLTRQLLTFSRRQVLEPDIVDVNDLLVNLEDMIRRSVGANVEVRLKLEDHPWSVRTDAGQLEDAVINLTVNARDAMPQGGALTIETAKVTISEGEQVVGREYMLPGDYLMLAVTDTGTGIPKDVQERIFEPFFTTKEQGKGTGLGMAMIYGFAKQSKGYVNVYSEEGHGTCIKLYLPRHHTTAQAVEPDSVVRTDEDITATVLVAEDDPDVRQIAVNLLSDFGYHVIEAENGLQALEIIQAGEDVDLLFTDMVMPGGMGGLELAKKASSHRSGLKVVYTSGYTEKGPFNDDSGNEKIHWLTKPYTRAKLAKKMREALSQPKTGVKK